MTGTQNCGKRLLFEKMTGTQRKIALCLKNRPKVGRKKKELTLIVKNVEYRFEITILCITLAH